jgi:hypothetical protein
VSKVIAQEERFIKKLSNNSESLQNIVRAINSVYEKYGTFRLFSPNFQRREELLTRAAFVEVVEK